MFILLFVLTLVSHATPYETGKKLYMERGCNGCHGNKAEGLHNYPRLANRAKGFLTYKLERFRSKISDNQQQEMMIPFALELSDAEIDALTTFLYEYVDEGSAGRYDDSYQTHGDGGS